MKKHWYVKYAGPVVILAFVILGVLWSEHAPLVQCQVLREAIFSEISRAKEIRVVEHSNLLDYLPQDGTFHEEKIYTRVVLDEAQIAQLKKALPLAFDYSATRKSGCVFEPHHRIEITRKDNSVFIIEICLYCGDLDLGEGPRMLPEGWGTSLRTFFSSLSMRPDGPWTIGGNPSPSSK